MDWLKSYTGKGFLIGLSIAILLSLLCILIVWACDFVFSPAGSSSPVGFCETIIDFYFPILIVFAFTLHGGFAAHVIPSLVLILLFVCMGMFIGWLIDRFQKKYGLSTKAKAALVVIISVVYILIFFSALAVYFDNKDYLSGVVEEIKTKNCAKEGEFLSDVLNESPRECCGDLNKINSMFADKTGECKWGAEAPFCTSSECGNEICESVENSCNCPEDCRKEELDEEQLQDEIMRKMMENEEIVRYLKYLCHSKEENCGSSFFYKWKKENNNHYIAFLSHFADEEYKADPFNYSPAIFLVNLETGEVQSQSAHDGSFYYRTNLYWQTYSNEEYGYEINIPSDAVMRDPSKDTSGIFWDGKLDGVPYILIFSFISQDDLNRMGVSYCGAHSDDERCEVFKWRDLNAGIDWNIEAGEGAYNHANAQIQHPELGQVVISLMYRPTQDVKTFFHQILATFKFTEAEKID
jgi:hypothetical protein